MLVGGAVALINYLVFFWINRKRQWKREDEEFKSKRKQEALQELIETQQLLESGREDYINSQTYKTNEVDKVMEDR